MEQPETSHCFDAAEIAADLRKEHPGQRQDNRSWPADGVTHGTNHSWSRQERPPASVRTHSPRTERYARHGELGGASVGGRSNFGDDHRTKEAAEPSCTLKPDTSARQPNTHEKISRPGAWLTALVSCWRSPSHDRAAHTGGWRRPLLRSVRSKACVPPLCLNDYRTL